MLRAPSAAFVQEAPAAPPPEEDGGAPAPAGVRPLRRLQSTSRRPHRVWLPQSFHFVDILESSMETFMRTLHCHGRIRS